MMTLYVMSEPKYASVLHLSTPSSFSCSSVTVCIAVSHSHTGDRWGCSQSDVAHTPSYSPYCFWGLNGFV